MFEYSIIIYSFVTGDIMSSKDFNIEFIHQNEIYDLNLVEGEESDHSVEINGVSYAVLGEKDKLDTACEILKSLSLDSISSSEDLKDRLSLRGDISFPQAQKTDEIGVQTLGTKSVSKPEIGEWNTKEQTETLPNKRNFVGEKMWAKFEETHQKPEGLRDFLELPEEKFEEAYENKDNLKKIFAELEREPLEVIIANEKLQRTFSPDSITLKSVDNLKQYMAETGFSGVISISDGKHVYTCKSENIPSSTMPFNLQSVTKVFTGVLSLLTFDKDDLDRPAQFDQGVMERLPVSIQEYLEDNKPTVKQLMAHTAGLGDYTVNYQDARETGILLRKLNESGEKIQSVDDFLRFTNEQIFKADPNIFKMINGVRAHFVELLIMSLHQDGLITQEILNQKFELPDYLPTEVKEYLSKLDSPLTLKTIMQAGLEGDVEKYKGDVEKYKKMDFTKVLDVRHAEDLLMFADTTTHSMGEINYSNLGMLLLGLSIQHHYNQENGTKKEFQEIVFDEIAQKAGMKTFTPIKPKNGRISPIDSEANGHIYGAGSGGYWSTSEDLIKFGQWLNENVKGEFRHLIEEHGEEFHESGVIKHKGDGDHSSTYFSTHLDSGISIAILSDQGESVATKMHDDILDFMFPKSLKV